MQNLGMQSSPKHTAEHIFTTDIWQFCKFQNLTSITCFTFHSESKLRARGWGGEGGGVSVGVGRLKARVSSTSQNSALTHRRTVMRPAYLMIRTDESHQLIRVWSPWHCVVRADWETDVLSSGAGPLPAWIMTCSNPVNWKAFRVTLSATTSTI